MANPSAAHEPSMEEILASIRQIISEDTDRTVPASKSEKVRAAKDAASSGPAASAASVTGEMAATLPAAAPAKPAAAPPVALSSAAVGKSAAKSEQPVANSSASSAATAATTTAAGDGDRDPAPQAAESTRASVAVAPGTAEPPSDTGKLLSEHSKAAVESAFGALAHTILAQNARTLEDIVADMMRPMLKTWLDSNLPALVERLVREEIERVSRGRR